jgi:hypothetical protein
VVTDHTLRWKVVDWKHAIVALAFVAFCAGATWLSPRLASVSADEYWASRGLTNTAWARQAFRNCVVASPYPFPDDRERCFSRFTEPDEDYGEQVPQSVCRDGYYSYAFGKGACLGHGGVRRDFGYDELD